MGFGRMISIIKLGWEAAGLHEHSLCRTSAQSGHDGAATSLCYNSRMRGLVIYSLLLLCATAKIVSMPDHSFDGHLYSYLVSHNVQEFKADPGVPKEYVAIPDASYVQQAPFYRVKV